MPLSICICSLLILIYPVITDIKKREIPLWFFPIMYTLIYGVMFFYLKMNRKEVLYSIVWMLILLAFGIIQAYFFGLGGADALLFGFLGILYKEESLIIVLGGFLLTLPYLLIRKKTKEYAFFPYIWVSNFIYIFIKGVGIFA